MKLEELLRTKVKSEGINGVVEISPDFRVAVQAINDIEESGVRIIIHPYSHNGETLDFIAKGNTLEQIVNGQLLTTPEAYEDAEC
jgi:hypothetical protein